MSSSYDAGYYASEAAKCKDGLCPKGGEHQWLAHGSAPSAWEECSKCKETIYWK